MPESRLLRLLVIAGFAMTMFAAPAHSQIMSARRMAMGGVTLMHGGLGGDATNVAYRAVPADPRDQVRSFSLPIGVIPVLQDWPSFDPDDSTFNAFRLANLALHLPWNLALTEASEPEGDITLSVARNSLLIDLGTLRDVVPSERVRMAESMRTPALVLGLRQWFVGVSPYAGVRNDFELDDTLRTALRDGAPFLPNTHYGLRDRGTAEAAVQAMVGGAFPLARSGGADRREGLYVGARARLLRGLAYADIDESVRFTTADTLFGSEALDLNLEGRARTATPKGGRLGHGFDAGVVWVTKSLELGLAANDLATSIDWRVEETVTAKDTASGDYKTVTVADGAAFTSTVPASYLLTAATRVGPIYLALDAERDPLEQTSGHVGAEIWHGPVALRAGAWTDSRAEVQVSGGVGLRFGALGIDVAVATNQSNLTRERTLDLGAGLSWYPRRKS